MRRRPSGRRPSGTRGRRLALGGLAFVVVAALLVAGYGWWTYQKVDRVDVDLADVAHGEPRNYLIVGSDSRESVDEDDPNAALFLGDDAPGGQRSDSISILRVDPDGERIDVLSIPRDLWVELPDGSEQRINAAYAQSTQTLIDTIDKNLGIPIHHFAEVDFVGFQRLIDALGGVPMYFDSAVRDKNSGLSISGAGCAVLDGPQGLAFARSRHLEYEDSDGWHTDGTGDLGRMTRQQLLMRAALGKARSLGLDDIGRLKGLIDAGLESTTVDSGLGFGDILGLGRRFSDFDPQRLQTHSLAVEGDRTSGGASVLTLDEGASYLTLAFFQGVEPAAPVTTTTTPPASPSDVNVSIYNGGGVAGEARRVSYALTDGGFRIGFVDTAPENLERSVVRYPSGGESMGELVASWLGPSPKMEEDDSLDPGQVVVTLGADFEHVAEPSTPDDSDSGDAPGSDDSDTTGVDGTGGSELAGGSGGQTSSSSSTTTTTTTPGWTPVVAAEVIDCT
ncbi:MAG: LCP family protein [Microthrixaceae bacterium]|nr:LCP family protein [Microthrixaceae bacterium]